MGSAPPWHDAAVPDEPGPVVPPAPGWPGPDLLTLRAVVELDLALDTDVTVDAGYGWYAHPPGTGPGRQAFRRAVRRRRESARAALLPPARPRVAGRRCRG